MRLQGSNNAGHFAKQLRRQMTPPEIALWLALRRNDARLRFRKQHAASDYIIDFYCAPAKLAIEVDGEAHDFGDGPAKDAKRDAWLASQDIRVLRYRASEVLTNVDGVVSQILVMALDRIGGRRRPPPPSATLPPPPGGGG